MARHLRQALAGEPRGEGGALDKRVVVEIGGVERECVGGAPFCGELEPADTQAVEVEPLPAGAADGDETDDGEGAGAGGKAGCADGGLPSAAGWAGAAGCCWFMALITALTMSSIDGEAAPDGIAGGAEAGA